MSTLKDSTLAPPAVPDTTLGPDPGQYRKPEIAVPDPAAEYPPPLDDDLRDFARQEYESEEVFQERWAAGAAKRAAEQRRRRKMKKMLLAVAGVAVAGVMALGAGSISKALFENGRIERADNCKDVATYIETIEEMIARKRRLFGP